MFLATKAQRFGSFFHRTGTPKPAAHSRIEAGYITFMSLPQPGSAAVAPALLGWSSPVAGPALPVPDRPRTAIIIMLPVVDACE